MQSGASPALRLPHVTAKLALPFRGPNGVVGIYSFGMLNQEIAIKTARRERRQAVGVILQIAERSEPNDLRKM